MMQKITEEEEVVVNQCTHARLFEYKSDGRHTTSSIADHALIRHELTHEIRLSAIHKHLYIVYGEDLVSSEMSRQMVVC
ncbi:hypothetical protein TNCV_538751 [Trichonephila clavipes]|nr:hypothetical protein TNCV_538751 [Trichonephila clavipes]